MKIKTKYFGEVEIKKEQIINFDEGIPGFEDAKKYALLYEEDGSPFYWLQSIDHVNVALVLISPVVFFSNYNIKVDDDKILSLGDLNQKDLIVYTVVVVRDDLTKMTTNLRAPIIINSKTKQGMQIIVDNEEYSMKQNVYAQLCKLKKDKAVND